MTYTTIQGDTWDIIALKTLGSENAANLIMHENPTHIGTLIFDSDVNLNIPEAATETLDDSSLPPWKRSR